MWAGATGGLPTSESLLDTGGQATSGTGQGTRGDQRHPSPTPRSATRRSLGGRRGAEQEGGRLAGGFGRLVGEIAERGQGVEGIDRDAHARELGAGGVHAGDGGEEGLRPGAVVPSDELFEGEAAGLGDFEDGEGGGEEEGERVLGLEAWVLGGRGNLRCGLWRDVVGDAHVMRPPLKVPLEGSRRRWMPPAGPPEECAPGIRGGKGRRAQLPEKCAQGWEARARFLERGGWGPGELPPTVVWVVAEHHDRRADLDGTWDLSLMPPADCRVAPDALGCIRWHVIQSTCPDLL